MLYQKFPAGATFLISKYQLPDEWFTGMIITKMRLLSRTIGLDPMSVYFEMYCTFGLRQWKKQTKSISFMTRFTLLSRSEGHWFRLQSFVFWRSTSQWMLHCWQVELVQLLYIQIDAQVGYRRVLYMESWSRCKSIHVHIVMFCFHQLILFCFTFICHHNFYLLSYLHIFSSISALVFPCGFCYS